MQVTVRFFAGCRETAKADSASFDLPAGANVDALRAAISERLPALAGYAKQVRYSVNWEYVTPDALLSDGDEVAMIPPVAGGV